MKTVLMLLTLISLPVLAVVDGHKYRFDDELSNKRFASLAEDLRCPKCQNQNLADSDAPVAADMRDKIYDMMLAGASDTEIVAYMVDRYGDFVRYTPPLRIETLLLWFGPLIMLALGLVLLIGIRRSQSATPAPLTAEEQARLQALKDKAKSS